MIIIIIIIEYGTFTPLVTLSNSGFGRECARFYSKLEE